MLQVSVLRFLETLSACIFGDESLCFQHMFSASAPPPLDLSQNGLKFYKDEKLKC